MQTADCLVDFPSSAPTRVRGSGANLDGRQATERLTGTVHDGAITDNGNGNVNGPVPTRPGEEEDQEANH
ncbi:hypothetical protein CFAM422_011647 [Trichoderma lentiforme]|uniref:Uncharacterized protein n=1 Tax=Trichoderma lentiforme TaxID=1567552 RepID=A0A9P4X571_9HYPO|nr:hypothetical protein CFAM422_011647 [Trichoderma lentiforme]